VGARGELLGRSGNRRAETGLVELLAALGDGCHEGDAEAATPIAEEVGEAGGTIILIGRNCEYEMTLIGTKKKPYPKP